MRTWGVLRSVAVAVVCGLVCCGAQAQALPHAAGTVKAVTATNFTVETAAGQDYTVAVPSGAKILEVAPGSRDLKSATSGSMGDIAVGDRVLVNGSAGDTGTTLNAQRVIVMKSAAIAQTHEAEEAAWADGAGGIVKSVDPATGTIRIASGLKMLTIETSPATILRRYSGESVRFQDAVASTIGEIHPGDQLRVRGTRLADGNTIRADEIVTGEFRHYSGLIASIDGTAGTLTLKDLATKKVVTVAVTPNSDLRRLPEQAAMRVAMQLHGGAAAGGKRAGSAVSGAAHESGEERTGQAGLRLSQMLSRLPTETLGGLKVGEAVMIVATASPQKREATAVTLLAGVEPILAASPAGDSMTLSPWSVGTGAPAEAGEGGPQ